MIYKKDGIRSKDNNLNPQIYEILNSAYLEFRQKHGDKHSHRIREVLENVTDKVRKTPLYYFGPIAMAETQDGIVYTESNKLSVALKHELWHMYNDVAKDKEISLQYVPQRYIDKLKKSGEIDFSECVVEMWTEWFNSHTHLEDMKVNFWEWGEGYFTKSLSSGSFYDSYINIVGMISCIIPLERLLDMYLHTAEYHTDYSYPEMLKEFDEKYMDSLDDKEKDEYGYPFLKIIMDVKGISDDARKQPTIALKLLQSCMKTCFGAYLQKLESMSSIDIEEARLIYFEIKYMQELMVWNVDILKMQELDYMPVLIKVQDKFKSMLKSLGIWNLEVREMFENIDYAACNVFEIIDGGDEISKKIVSTQCENRNRLISIYGNYKVNVGENGIKDNLYSTLFVLLGTQKYNLMYKNFQNSSPFYIDDNILFRFYRRIENATTDEEFINIYNDIYELYAQKLKDTLKINENLETKLDRYSKEIVVLQENGPFDPQTKKYLPGLERIIDIYNKSVEAYKQEIDKITENDIQINLEKGYTQEEAENFARKIPDFYKKRLNEQQRRISIQIEKQVVQYTQLSREQYLITTLKIGRKNMSKLGIDGELIELVKKAYVEFVKDLNFKIKELTPHEIIRLLNSSLITYEGRFSTRIIVEDDGVPQLIIVLINQDNEEEQIKIECIELKSIIDSVNQKSLDEANKTLERIASAGVGEYTLSKANNHYVIGFEKDEPNEELDGELETNEEEPQVNDLCVECRYEVIRIDDMSLENRFVRMTPAQIRDFNKVELIEVTEIPYERYDNRTFSTNEDLMYSFIIGGQQYYIRNADWTNGGTYTIVWKLVEDKNVENQKENAYPQLAIGISANIDSMYARDQRGVNIYDVINFISQNPIRFEKYYQSKVAQSDLCRLFPTDNLYRMMYNMLCMGKESELSIGGQELTLKNVGEGTIGVFMDNPVEAGHIIKMFGTEISRQNGTQSIEGEN